MRLLLAFLILGSIIGESTLTSFPATLLLISVVSILLGREAAFWAAGGGVVLDLFLPRLLGVDSLFFLLVVFLSSRYQKKISAANLFYPILFLAIVFASYSFLFLKRVVLWQGILFVVLGLFLLFVFSRFLGESYEKKKIRTLDIS